MGVGVRVRACARVCGGVRACARACATVRGRGGARAAAMACRAAVAMGAPAFAKPGTRKKEGEGQLRAINKCERAHARALHASTHARTRRKP